MQMRNKRKVVCFCMYKVPTREVGGILHGILLTALQMNEVWNKVNWQSCWIVAVRISYVMIIDRRNDFVD